MSALSELNSKRSHQQAAKAIDSRVVRRLGRVVILAMDGRQPSAGLKRTARYGVKRHAQPKVKS
jgi:hypothetical protein